MQAITISNLTKDFHVRDHSGGLAANCRRFFRPKTKKVSALSGISFHLDKGDCVAFVGPNGAGKSTTIKILAGILTPTSGTVSVLGLSPTLQRRQLSYRVGTVFGQRSQLWFHLPAVDSFDLLGRIYDLDWQAYGQRRDDLVTRFEISSLIHKPVRQLSLGERMRCEIVASLIHRPEILFLDEPTIGLDATAKTIIRDFIAEISASENCTVLLTSHDTGDMERLCQRMIVLNHGQVVVDDKLSALRNHYIKTRYLTVKTKAERVSTNKPGAKVVHQSRHQATIAYDTQICHVGDIIQDILQQTRIMDLTVKDPPLEDIIKLIYGKKPQ